MLYTDAFKGTTYLYVGEGFGGGEDMRFTKSLLLWRCHPPPFPSLSYSVDPHTYTHTRIHIHIQMYM